MNIYNMIKKAKNEAPSAPQDNPLIENSFLVETGKKTISWNDPSFFAGGSKRVSEWNLKDMLKFCEERYALKHGFKPDFAIRPAMMAMSGLRHIFEMSVGKNEVNSCMHSYIEWYISNMQKWWKGSSRSWYPQKMVSDSKIKEFLKNNLASNSSNVKKSFSKRPVNAVLLEEFYRGDALEFICAYGIVIPGAFLIKTKGFSREDAISFVFDAIKRGIGSGAITLSKIVEINEHYRPFERLEEIDPEEFLISVRKRFS